MNERYRWLSEVDVRGRGRHPRKAPLELATVGARLAIGVSKAVVEELNSHLELLQRTELTAFPKAPVQLTSFSNLKSLVKIKRPGEKVLRWRLFVFPTGAAMQEDVEELRAKVLELQSTLAAAERERNRLVQQCAEQQHRIRNALQALELIVSAQAQGAQQPELCIRCISRIASISQLNEALCDDKGDINVAAFLSDLSHSIQQAFGDRFNFHTDIEPDHRLERNRARCLGLIFSEAAMNALKHGFRDANAGMLTTKFIRQGDDYEMVVEDDGTGFEATVFQEGRGLGYMKQLADQLGGVLTIERLQCGSRVRLKFPA